MEPDALGLLRRDIERLHAASFNWALACSRYDRHEAEDTLHATYLKVMEGKARFDGRSTLKTWLFAVIRRTAVDRRRTAWLRGLRVGQWLTGETAARPDEDVERDQRQERVRAALRSLPGRQHEVLELVFYHRLTIEEAAGVMGVALGTARVHYERGKRRLSMELGDL